MYYLLLVPPRPPLHYSEYHYDYLTLSTSGHLLIIGCLLFGSLFSDERLGSPDCSLLIFNDGCLLVKPITNNLELCGRSVAVKLTGSSGDDAG